MSILYEAFQINSFVQRNQQVWPSLWMNYSVWTRLNIKFIETIRHTHKNLRITTWSQGDAGQMSRFSVFNDLNHVALLEKQTDISAQTHIACFYNSLNRILLHMVILETWKLQSLFKFLVHRKKNTAHSFKFILLCFMEERKLSR